MGSKKQQTSTSTSTNESWFLKETGIKDIIKNVIANAGSLPEQELAELTPEQKEALNQIMQGRDPSQLQAGAGWFGQTGAGATGAGMGAWQQNMDRLNQLYGEGGMLTEQGYQDAIKNMYNSDLVNQQLEVAGTAIQDQLGKAVQGINQRAAGSGGMGSSRAGVAEGVATGKAADALASATANIQGQAYQQAIQGANQQIGNIMGGLQTGINAGSNMFGQGGQFVGQGMNWGNTIQGNQMQDLFNKFGAGSIYQQMSQAQKDRDYWNKLQQATGGLSTLLPILGPTASWGGTTTTTGTTSGGKGGFGGLLGGLAGAAIGGMTGGIGTGLGSSLGSAFGEKFSDKRLKKNITKAEKRDGIQYYDWDWNAKAKEEGIANQPTHGVIAQEVKKKYPDVVKKQDNGYLAVDYKKLEAKKRNARRKKRVARKEV